MLILCRSGNVVNTLIHIKVVSTFLLIQLALVKNHLDKQIHSDLDAYLYMKQHIIANSEHYTDHIN